jgi:hypothetical protein
MRMICRACVRALFPFLRNLPYFRRSSKATRRVSKRCCTGAETGTRIAEGQALNAFEQMLLRGAASSSLNFAELHRTSQHTYALENVA